MGPFRRGGWAEDIRPGSSSVRPFLWPLNWLQSFDDRPRRAPSVGQLDRGSPLSPAGFGAVVRAEGSSPRGRPWHNRRQRAKARAADSGRCNRRGACGGAQPNCPPKRTAQRSSICCWHLPPCSPRAPCAYAAQVDAERYLRIAVEHYRWNSLGLPKTTWSPDLAFLSMPALDAYEQEAATGEPLCVFVVACCVSVAITVRERAKEKVGGCKRGETPGGSESPWDVASDWVPGVGHGVGAEQGSGDLWNGEGFDEKENGCRRGKARGKEPRGGG